MSTNKVTVKIYGQEYTLAGDKSNEEIEEIASYVDGKMRELGALPIMGGANSLAVLTAVVLTEEVFEKKNEIESLKLLNEQLEKDAQYYLQMWEDSKKSFAKYKDGILSLQSKKQEENKRVKELEEKVNEYETNYFDLQMENIKLKDRLNKLQQNNNTII